MNTDHKIVNIDTVFWTPEQVARWLQQQVDDGAVQSVYVIVERVDDDDDDDVMSGAYIQQWSRAPRQSLLFMMTWAYQGILRRYFGQ